MAHTATHTAVAYLVSHYPAVSHAFIEREIIALRELGVEVQTFTVRPADASELLSQTMRDEAARTTALLGRPAADHVRAQAALLARHPVAWGRTLASALATGQRTVRARLWQAFYFAEAVTLQAELSRRGLRHVHVHFANNGADVARLAVRLGRAVDGPEAGWRWTFSMHGPTEFADPLAFDLAAKFSSADAVACISEFCRTELRALAPGGGGPRTGIVRMAVDPDRFAADADLRATRLEGPVRVLFVGRLVEEKGPDVLLDAVQRVVAAGRRVEVAVVGAGPLADDLHRTVERSGLAGIVRLTGAVGQDELPSWYRWADVFCLPSYAEGVPVVLMEAMATELPVVTTPVAGIPELVEDGTTGFLVPPGDAAAVADALLRLVDDPTTRARLGRGGRQRVLADFLPATNARRLADLLGLTPPDRVVELLSVPAARGTGVS